MKKIILTIAIVLGIGFGVSAQSDAFFTQSFSEYRNADEEMPLLPICCTSWIRIVDPCRFRIRIRNTSQKILRFFAKYIISYRKKVYFCDLK